MLLQVDALGLQPNRLPEALFAIIVTEPSSRGELSPERALSREAVPLDMGYRAPFAFSLAGRSPDDFPFAVTAC